MASSATSGELSITKARSWKPWSPRGQDCGAEVSETHHEEIWPPQDHRDRWALLLSRGNERGRHQRSTRGWSTAQQSGGEFSSAISTTRAGYAEVSQHEDPAKIQFDSRRGPQPFQSGASSRQARRLQTQTLSRA